MILQHLDYWHWWILGVVLVILEAFAPGAFFLWMGIAAGLIGFVMLAVPDLAWEYQISLFALLSVGSIVAWRIYLHRNPIQTDRPTLNRRGEQYIDRVFSLTAPVENGVGKIQVDDSTWKIEGEDCEAGTKVKVVATDGVILKIERAE